MSFSALSLPGLLRSEPISSLSARRPDSAFLIVSGRRPAKGAEPEDARFLLKAFDRSTVSEPLEASLAGRGGGER